MYDNNKSNLQPATRRFNPVRVLPLVLLLVSLSAGQNLLAVFDLQSDSSVSARTVSEISDRISAVIAEDSTYFQFERAQIPELLKQLLIDESASACSDVQCLTVIGSLIGANFMVGGSIRHKGRETSIELNLVDVAAKKIKNTVNLQCRSSKNALLETEIPALTKALMSSPSNKIARPGSGNKEKKSVLKNPLVYIGTGVAGLAAGGVYYYFNYYKKGDAAPESSANGEISLGDAPARTRNE
jgi:hypothetical protein